LRITPQTLPSSLNAASRSALQMQPSGRMPAAAAAPTDAASPTDGAAAEAIRLCGGVRA
jgi:hypothetical protein